MQIEEMDFLHSPRMQELRNQAVTSQEEDDKKLFLAALVKQIISALSDVTVSNIENGVNINNLDEVKAHLRNELSKANKPITDILNKLNMSTEEQTNVIKEIETKAVEKAHGEYQTVIVRRVKDTVQVENFQDIEFPKEINVNNLTELSSYLEEIINKISALKLEVTLPAPQVSVNPTPVNIPAPILNVPAVDLEPIISALNDNLKLLKTNNKSRPLAVRLTDGGDWIREIVKIQKETSKAVAAFAGGANMVRLLDTNMNVVDISGLATPTTAGSGKTTVTTAGTRVVLASSTSVNSVTIKALSTNTGIVYVGNSTVASTDGFQLIAGESVSLSISNLATIYLDSSVDAQGVTYMWVK